MRHGKAKAASGSNAVDALAIPARSKVPDGYKWLALSNTTLGVLLATIDGSIVIVAMPDIFRGIHLNPLQPGNSFYLLWMILGYLVVTSVLVVGLGRLGDLFGRVRMYTIGFGVYTVASLLLTIDWMDGAAGANWLIAMRLVQGVGGAFIIANSGAILTDAFPPDQRGLALGLNNVVGISGTFIGLVLGGVLAPIDWRLVFLVSVPPGLAGTLWSRKKLREIGERNRAPIDWIGNITFALGLVLIMVGITYGIRPYKSHPMGWSSPFVLTLIASGIGLLVAFVIVEAHIRHPMFKLSLFRIRPFTFGVLSSFLASVARGGLMFMLIIWLQSIWLPVHGYGFARTPFWAGIYMLPFTVGLLSVGLVSGLLSDRYGSRPFATAGMLGSALGFVLLLLLPVDFSYPMFAGILLLMGMSMGAFASPNRAGVMNSLPAGDRGVGGAMFVTFQNSGQVLSIGIFFTLMIIGLTATLPTSLGAGLRAHGVPAATAAHVAQLPPISVLFAAFLGDDPAQQLIGPHVLTALSPANAAAISSHHFFASLIAAPFRTGLRQAFAFGVAACLLAAIMSWSRGPSYVASERYVPTVETPEVTEPDLI